MADYGEFVPQALMSSQDKYYYTLGKKLDLYRNLPESAYPVFNGTHAYIQSYLYSLIFFWDTYKVSHSHLWCLMS